MKRTLFLIALVYITAIVVVISCNKPSYNKGNVITVTQSLNQLFVRLRTTPQSLSVEAGRDTVVFGNHGTMLHFYVNSFKDGSDNIITSGTINLQLIEMYKPGDMIANRAVTTENERPLISGGQVSIGASKDGRTVYANKYGIGFKQPASSSAPMELYFGSTANTDSLAIWTVGNNTTPGTTAAGTTTDSSHLPAGIRYVFDSCTNFTFVNCDHPFTAGSSQIVTKFTFPDSTFNRGNTQIFVCFPSYNSVVGNSGHSFDPVTATISGYFYAPAGANYKLVAMANKTDGMYYYETTGTVPADSLKLNIAVALGTEADILTQLSGL